MSQVSQKAAMTGVAAGAGCLVIVFNYTGDRLNFGRAVAQATQAGTQVAESGTGLRETDTECRGLTSWAVFAGAEVLELELDTGLCVPGLGIGDSCL